MMAATENEKELSGEERLRQRRARLIRFVLLSSLVSLIIAFIIGYFAGRVEGTIFAPWIGVIAAITLVGGMTWYVYAYFEKVDELDLMDNLWASLIGFYFYLLALPVWFILANLNALPELNHFAIYIGTGIIAGVAYCARKLGLR